MNVLWIRNWWDTSSYRLHCMPSHLIASSPARCRVVRPPGNLDRGQSFTIWLIVCFAAPQLQDGSGIFHQRARFAAHCPWPVLKRFKFAHRCRGKLKPGGRAVGSSTKDCLITSVSSHSSHHLSRADNSSRGTSTILDAVMAYWRMILDVCVKWQAIIPPDLGQQFCCCFLPAKIRRCNVTKYW